MRGRDVSDEQLEEVDRETDEVAEQQAADDVEPEPVASPFAEVCSPRRKPVARG
jgi:hypothetical protein